MLQGRAGQLLVDWRVQEQYVLPGQVLSAANTGEQATLLYAGTGAPSSHCVHACWPLDEVVFACWGGSVLVPCERQARPHDWPEGAAVPLL